MNPMTDGQERYLKYLEQVEPEKFKAHMKGRLISDLDNAQAAEILVAIKQDKAEYDGDHPEGEGHGEGEAENQGEGQGEPQFREGSMRGIIEQSLRENGIDEEATKDELGPQVGKKPLQFNRNPTAKEKREGKTKRQPLPMTQAEAKATGQPTQHERFEQVVKDVAEAMRKAGGQQEQQEEKPPKEQAIDWLDRIQNEVRPHVSDKGFAEVSMRMPIAGAKMFKAMGDDPAAFKAVEFSVSLAWPPESKTELRIQKFHPGKVKCEPQKVVPPKITTAEHKVMGWIEVLIAAGVPVALIGPAGCGKSFLPAQYAAKHGKPFGLVPMTAGASTTWLTGAFTLEGWVTRPFVDIYENGGVFLFDEMDAADPNMLLLVNNALANDQFQNPANGKYLKKHEDFLAFAAMNTLGTGANRRYVGRERLDMATLDRWAPGMVEMGYDNNLEREIFESIINS